MTPTHYDVFISRKSQDAHLAKELYDFLTSKGLKVFDSDHSLQEMGNADYQKTIDYALDACMHMIVVGSSVENITAPWVEAEWRLFINEKRSGRKMGNIISVVSDISIIQDLPSSLRYFEAIELSFPEYNRILAYVVNKSGTDASENNPLKQIISDSELDEWRNKVVYETQKENFKEAFSLCLKLSQYENPNDQVYLGYLFEIGQGTEQNYYEATRWYRKAALQGYADGQCNLGTMYRDGMGVPRDYSEAGKWYRKAAEQGHARAQVNLGVLYNNGQGVNQDFREAVKWHRKSATNGSPLGQLYLANMYELGRGIKKNISLATKYYRLSAKQGNELAQEALKRLNETW
jgi:TPR repeat protein